MPGLTLYFLGFLAQHWSSFRHSFSRQFPFLWACLTSDWLFLQSFPMKRFQAFVSVGGAMVCLALLFSGTAFAQMPDIAAMSRLPTR